MQIETTISGRFNGPPASGNGGYSCGLLAAHLPGPARVRLHVPPPMDTALQIARTESGGVQLYHGDVLVASGEKTTLQLDIPAPPTEQDALAAMSGFPCYEDHLFPTCFVCGPKREQRDGLELFAGPVAGAPAVWACVWHPAVDLWDDQNNIRPEILWSALDCPGYFAAMQGNLRPAVLGELVGDLRGPVPGTGPLVVYAWSLGEEGRKFYAGTAIASGGEIMASARSTWIELKSG